MLDDILGRYRSFLRLPDVVRLLVTALITRLPIASLTLAMLMHVRTLTGSFTEAGLTVGVDLAASAIAAPALGRIIDRRGPRAVMLVTGIVCPLALLFILLADRLTLSVAALIAAAAIAGVFAPPITVLTRTVWRYRFDDPGERRTAFALDAVLIELAFTVGPMLVALLLAVASPRAAFAAACLLVALAVPIFAWSPALKYWRHQPGVERRLLGPLADPRLLAVYAVTFLLMFSLGLLEIGYAGFATAAGMPAFAGVGIAPALTVVMLLISTNAPSRYATEAFTWSTTFLVGGLGAGHALGGSIVQAHGARAVFGVAAGAAAMAAIGALGVRQRKRQSASIDR